MTRKTKRELILEIFEAAGFEELSDPELQFINARLVEIHGRGGAASPAYIASTLIAAGKRVRYEDDLGAVDEPPAAAELLNFAGLFNFDNLSTAESSLMQIDRYYRRCQANGDEVGMDRCRELARRGRIRARLIADNEKVAPEKRELKTEIAFWFELWLGNPDLFADWLALRKSTADFQQRFGLLTE